MYDLAYSYSAPGMQGFGCLFMKDYDPNEDLDGNPGNNYELSLFIKAMPDIYQDYLLHIFAQRLRFT